MLRWSFAAIVVGLGLLGTAARAEEEVDTTKLYDLGVQATAQVTKGGSGTVSIKIAPKAGAEIHKEAPVSISFEAPKNVALSKSTLSRPDMKMDGTAATFEVPFTGTEAGKGTIEAKLSFFICTDKMCSKQQRTASLPVTVR